MKIVRDRVEGPNGELPYRICDYLNFSGDQCYFPGDRLRFKDLETKIAGLEIINISALDFYGDDFSDETFSNLTAKYQLQISCLKDKYDIENENCDRKLEDDLKELFNADGQKYSNKITPYSIIEIKDKCFVIELKLAEENVGLHPLTEIDVIESHFSREFWDRIMDQIVTEGVCYSPFEVNDKLRNSLRKNICHMASIMPVDYHPNSRDIVRDLVHPALYPYVKGVSQLKKDCVLPDKSGEEAKEDFWGRPYEESNYQWLPTPFYVSSDGKCTIKDYINNLDRNKFGPVYNDLEELFEIFLPYFEEVWNYVKSVRLYKNRYDAESIEEDQCHGIYIHKSKPSLFSTIYFGVKTFLSTTIRKIVNYMSHFQDGKDILNQELQENKDVDVNVSNSKVFDLYSPVPENMLVVPDHVKREENVLHDRELQVIVKIVDYTLQPQQEYEGVWHAEGMSHENIVMTGIYFIDRDPDLQGGILRFKRLFTNKERNAVRYSVPQDRPSSFNEFACDGYVPLGHFPTEEGYMLVFPNCHIHKIGKLINKASDKTSSRRIIVFFVVNPDRKIISTREIAPQQDSISLTQAKAYRLELMAERKYDKEKLNVRDIELCEH